MNIIKLTLGELAANCFIVEADDKTAVVIDPGAEAEVIIEELESRGLTLGKILLTHGHFDHTGAAAELKEKYRVPVYISAVDEELLDDKVKSVAYILPEIPFCPVQADVRIKEGDVITQGSLEISVMETPGHTAGSVCFIIDDCMFTGDTLFHRTIGRTDHFSGDTPTEIQSVKRLAALDKNYRLYCGHGADTDLDTERKTNPFITGAY